MSRLFLSIVSLIVMAMLISVYTIGFGNGQDMCTGVAGSCYTWGVDHPQYKGYCCMGGGIPTWASAQEMVKKNMIDAPAEFGHCATLTTTTVYSSGQEVCGFTILGTCGGQSAYNNCVPTQ
ncbi:MAG: hypothetical protein FWE63_08815 [Bacteroidales bacterium]|nr:hypothetical protein [Bacteroidales bacterium]